jgi:hypothetical protein
MVDFSLFIAGSPDRRSPQASFRRRRDKPQGAAPRQPSGILLRRMPRHRNRIGVPIEKSANRFGRQGKMRRGSGRVNIL